MFTAIENQSREELSRKARDKAEKLYKNGDYLCSEAILITINELLEEPFQKDIVKLASGFPVGIGGAGCSCGAISGGVMALGLVFGRVEPGADNNKIMEASNELYQWFVEENKNSCCRILIEDLEFGSKEHLEQCINFTGIVAGKTTKLIYKYMD